MFVSQPLAALPSQFPNPALHDASVQTPAVHDARPFANAHTRPHAPQWAGSVCGFTHAPEQFTVGAVHES